MLNLYQRSSIGETFKLKIKIKTKIDKTKKLKKTLNLLNTKKVNVGVYGKQAWLAGIHEYGCDIKPKSGKYLTIPISPKSVGKKAKDFPDLFYIESKTGEKFLAIGKKANGKNDIELLFWLVKSVHIPERSFLRAGFDECIKEINKKSDILLKKFLDGTISEDSLFDFIGNMLASKIKNYASSSVNPPNKTVTVNNKKSDNPLVDTGDMINSITYKVE